MFLRSVIQTSLHLLACFALAGVCIRGFFRAQSAGDLSKSMFPFLVVAGLAGLWISLSGLREWFVARYSGAIYEIKAQGGGWAARAGISVLLYLLPVVGFIPQIAARPGVLGFIGLLAAAPSLIHVWQCIMHDQATEIDGLSDVDADE